MAHLFYIAPALTCPRLELADCVQKMPDFTHKRFDDRILDREDDGGAFERFVDEFLSRQEPDTALVRGLAKGPDGAIDLSDQDAPITRIVECKFIGAQSKDKAADRWGQVRSNLENNLPPLAAGDDKGRGRYRPWLRSQGNLSTYTFVTSAIAASTDERTTLKRSIEEFFADLSDQHPDLNHLRRLKVELRYWDDLIGKAASFPQLFYRWFGGLPYGYGDIALSFGSEAGFKRFLESRHLPYFSRDAYLEETGGKRISHFESTLDHLTTGNGPRTGVISGPGGVGKTRLAIELCEAARQRDWWPVRLDRKAQATDLTKLCQSHATGARLLLFVDYAEACEDLEGFATEMGRLALEGGHQLSLLASTRASSIQQVLDRLSALAPEETVLDPEADPAFDAWVVRKILAHFAVPEAEAVAQSCSGLPVMAAFAGFLLQSDKAQFEKQFGNLAAVKDFADWSARRLQAIEDRFQGQLVRRLLAELAVRLPMPEAEVEAFRATSEVHDQLFAVLRADHWIEPEGAGFAAAHDVLADAMLARHLSEMPKDEQLRLQTLLIAALTEGRLDRCLAAVDRLGAHPVFARLSGCKAVKTLLRRDRERTLAALPMLAQSRLLPPSDLIAVLAEEPDVGDRLAKEPQSHLVLARAAEWAALHAGDAMPRATAEVALAAPLATATDWPNPSNIILRCAHAFDPARYEGRVLDRIVAEPGALSTHYLLVSLLRWGTPPETVRPHLLKWLPQNETARKASFVYKSWLDATGEAEAVRTPLLGWLEQHGATPEAQFVYKSWLDATGEAGAEAVRAPLLGWLEQHGATPEARFVYKSWLDATGEAGAVRAPLLGWLEQHGATPEASFVYQSWLDAKGEAGAVRAPLLGWLEQHGATTEAQFVYKSWLDATGEAEAVRAPLLGWLEQHGATLDARFVYKSWLDATGEAGAVRAPLLGWLEQHGATPEAQFVYRAWLDATGEAEAVRDHLIAWIEINSSQEEADFVFRAWLEAGEPLDPIKAACEAWLFQHWQSEEAVYLTKALSMAHDLSPKGVACIIAWAGTHPESEDAIFRLSRVSNRFANLPLNDSFRALIAWSVEAVLGKLLVASQVSENEQQTTTWLLENLSQSSFARNLHWIETLEHFCACLRHGGLLRYHEGLPCDRFTLLLHDALALRLLDPLADACAIRHVHDLIRQGVPPSEYAQLIAHGYLPPPPSEDR
ncbi:hypothetical protein SAMN05877809_10575 [Rhodobacter sp. JA431]|uniref:hypothetical protein n=1 Tax=Rhodobacter sp. JA431 TaxID=570013 RepID=UPI000BD42C4E|nr:hypothetical protein [Rhodobacter sp. JA431]SOC10152.1 hypothetical protein SAMN05877809_10575 [Rhodobacter sp. JA431]